MRRASQSRARSARPAQASCAALHRPRGSGSSVHTRWSRTRPSTRRSAGSSCEPKVGTSHSTCCAAYAPELLSAVTLRSRSRHELGSKVQSSTRPPATWSTIPCANALLDAISCLAQVGCDEPLACDAADKRANITSDPNTPLPGPPMCSPLSEGRALTKGPSRRMPSTTPTDSTSRVCHAPRLQKTTRLPGTNTLEERIRRQPMKRYNHVRLPLIAIGTDFSARSTE